MSKMTLTGKGRRWLTTGHPWVYSDDLAGGEAEAGELVPVEDPSGKVVGWGLFSGHSKIAVRMVSKGEVQPTRDFWAARMAAALARREEHGLLDPEGACRLVSGDADGFPGMVIDRYGTTAVLQSGAQGSDRMRDFIVELLEEALPYELTAVVDRSDSSVRKHEGLEPRTETLKGEVTGPILVREGQVEYEVDVFQGHKTGAYLDQRDNRLRAAQYAKDEDVLDAFSYDGLFALQAAMAGAKSVTCLEQNAHARERLLASAERNGVADRITAIKANCMQELRDRADKKEVYGLVIVDPPAFARSRKEASGAERGYVELNRRAADLIRPGGHLVSASCSYNVRSQDFTQYITKGAALAGREMRLVEMRGASPDHPYLLSLPESHYLKCAFLRVD